MVNVVFIRHWPDDGTEPPNDGDNDGIELTERVTEETRQSFGARFLYGFFLMHPHLDALRDMPVNDLSMQLQACVIPLPPECLHLGDQFAVLDSLSLSLQAHERMGA